MVKSSVIVCFYNRIDYLVKCLDSLSLNAEGFDEVVIADDGSCKDIVKQLERIIDCYDFEIVHAWHERKGARRAACRNNGIRHAHGDFLIFIDGDFLVLPGSIRSHIDAAKSGTFSAGRCKYLPEKMTEKIFTSHVDKELLEGLYLRLPEKPIKREHREFLRYGILWKLGLANERKQTFGGHFSAYRKDIEALNGYDENFVGWGGEDQDLALRMVKAGFSGQSVIKTARMLHMWHPKELDNKHWKEGPNIEYFHRNNIPVFCENGLIKRKTND